MALLSKMARRRSRGPRSQSGLDFQDISSSTGGPPLAPSSHFPQTHHFQSEYAQDASGTSYVPLTPAPGSMDPTYPKARDPNAPHLQRNKTERRRLQGLMRKESDWDLSEDGHGGSLEGGNGGGRPGLGRLPSRKWDGGRAGTPGAGFGPGVMVNGGGEGAALEAGAGKWTKWRAYMVNEGKRRIFVGVWLLAHALVFAFGFVHYQLKDNLTNARETFGITFTIARSSALVLHFDVSLLLFPICRNFISFLRRTPLNDIIPFDKNITFHKNVAWSLVFFTAVHTIAHLVNFGILASKTGTGVVGFVGANFLTGPGATGWIMNAVFAVMVWFAVEKRRRKNFERFWYSHHLFIVFFVCWQLHGMFCMIKPDRPPFCSYKTIGVFWMYWLPGGAIFIFERVLREVRARHQTYISKVILHPSRVVEVQIKKERTTIRAGQYVFINCPEVNYFQWHPFTLTSAPQEDYISVHIRMAGDWTTAFAKALGCQVDKPKPGEKSDKEQEQPMVLGRVLPRIMVDGPFGSASEDVFDFEVALIVGAGIGVTPCASLLKDAWYRINYPEEGKPTILSKIYFVWVCRDTSSAEWFQSLLSAIEEKDFHNRIEIHIYMTGAMKPDDLNNITIADVGSDRDPITGLRAPTHYGRPNWNVIFPGIRDRHPESDVITTYCGPPALGHTLHLACNKYTSGVPGETRFFWGKENF